MQKRIFETELQGAPLSLETGELAQFANGAVLVRYGDTVVLTTVTASSQPREGIDFFPLSVDYEEKMYSVGKIPGGFLKREGRPTENAVLTARSIDRPIRPLFPDGFRNEVQVIATVMSLNPTSGFGSRRQASTSIRSAMRYEPLPPRVAKTALIPGSRHARSRSASRSASDPAR